MDATFPAFDVTGMWIRKGDVITYPVRNGSTMRVKIGLVEKVSERQSLYACPEAPCFMEVLHVNSPSNSKQVEITRTELCTIVQRGSKGDRTDIRGW